MKKCATASAEAVPHETPQETLLASKQWHTAGPAVDFFNGLLAALLA